MCLSHRHSALLDGGRMPFPEPGVAPHYGPSRTVRITHAHVRLELEPEARSFRGRVRLSLEALPTYEGSFELDLDDVTLLSLEDGAGVPLAWSEGEGRIRVRAAVAPAVVVARWQGRDPQRGLYFTGPTAWEPTRQHMAWTQCQDEDAHFLMPCHDHPSAKHPWTIELDAPAGYTLLSNGRRVEAGERGGRSHATYEQAEPMAAYLFTAVAARLSAVEASWRDRPVRYLVPVGEEEAVTRAMGRTPEMMEAFSRITGVDFPWPRYDQVVVHDFIFGGMENVACTTMTDMLLVSADAIEGWDPDALVAHELAHQWFGDLVTCQDWSQGWLNESWATVMEAIWWEHAKGEPEAIWYRFLTAREYLEEHGGRYRRPIVSYDFREPIDVFDRHLYNKGSCVLWTLRAELGESAFWAGVKRYLTGHAHDTVHTRHFQRALEVASGRNLDGFFHQWVHRAGHPQLEVALASDDKLLTASVKQQQTGDDVPAAFAFGLRLVIRYAGGREQVVDLPVTERERTWAVPVDGVVETVRVDPGFRVLAEISLKAPDAWLAKLLDDACPVVAVRAARALLAKGGARALAEVVRALGAHPFHGVRSALADQLGRRGGPDARDALATALARESDSRVRASLAGALGAFREPLAVDALLADAARGWGSVFHRGAVIEALGKTRDPRGAALIQEGLAVRSWAGLVERKALAALGATEDPAALETLLAHSGQDHPGRVRAAAAGALGALADAVPATRAKVVERLIEVTREPGHTAQMAAIGALARVRDPGALGALEQLHRTAPDGRTRRSAYEAMVRIRQGRDGEEGLQALRARLDQLAEENAKLRARVDKLER